MTVVFRGCFNESCEHIREKGHACHAECVAIADGLDLLPFMYLPVLAYSYAPPKSDEKRRLELVRFRLQQALQSNVARLPTEVWDSVAKHLVCEFIIAAIPPLGSKTVFTIDPREAVWVKYVDIDGVKYVKSVSNEQRPGDRLLWDKPKSPTEHVIHIGEDHLGIKEITNHAEVTQLAPGKGVSTRWRTVPAKDASTIDFKDDGVKLRSFSIGEIDGC
ncbi:hypothetical protein LCI18_002096 [Fusarium solani-melongenae]|uniref:Uncharacterized protein n=1 Tax=Fusarium solani subsp. cucurbitae TaxID=2747967 RepID=A0ACD3YRD3_FUSSC|nr:hypothetical protein LCI18_002096 [Fusarium solani-melongenae]